MKCVIREPRHKYPLTSCLHSVPSKPHSLRSEHMCGDALQLFFKNHTINIYKTIHSQHETNKCGTESGCEPTDEQTNADYIWEIR